MTIAQASRYIPAFHCTVVKTVAAGDSNFSAQVVMVRMYVLRADGQLEPFSSLPLRHYGSCPNVGDTVCHSWFRERPVVYAVQRRYYVDNNDLQPGWAVILREIEPSKQSDAVFQAWFDDDDWTAKLDAEDAAEEQAEREKLNERLKLLLGTPPQVFQLDHREENAIKRLSRTGVGVPVVCRAINDFGEGTRTKLHRRGFVTVKSGATAKFKDDEIALTAAGAKAWKDLKAFRKKVDAARNSRDAGTR